MLAGMLAGAGPYGLGPDPYGEPPDPDALPLPETGPAPPPLVNQPPVPQGYEPPGGGIQFRNNPSSDRGNMLAAALAGVPLGTQLAGPPPQGAHYAQLPGPPLLLPGGGPAAPAAPAAPSAPPQSTQVAIKAPVTPPAGNSAISVPGYEGTFTRDQANDAEGVPSKAEWDAAAAPATRGSAGTSPASVAAAGNAGQGAPQENETVAAYRAQHDSNVAAYKRAIGMAQQTAGTPASAIWLKSAEEAAKAANDVNMKAIEYKSRLGTTKTLTDEQLTPAERAAGGEWQVNAAGERSQVGGTAGDTTRAPNEEESARIVAAGEDPRRYQVTDGKIEPMAPAKVDTRPAEIQAYEYDAKNREERGLPAISFSDWNTQKTTAGKAVEHLVGANGQPLDPELTGPAVLQQVAPEVSRMSQAMIEGRSPIPNLSVRTDPVTRQAVLAAQAADPSLDVGNATARVRVRNEFLAGGPSSPAARMTAGNNAINHIDEANYYAQELHDMGFDTVNAAANALTPGNSAVGRALKGYNTAVNNFAGEVVKFNTGSEGALEDRREKAALFSQNLTAGERKTAMESQLGILVSNMTSLQKRWRDGMGPLVPDFETIHPDSLQSIERIKGNAPYPPPGGLPPSMLPGGGLPESKPAPTAPQTIPARNVAPGVTGAPPRRGVYVPGKGIQFQ